MNLYTFLAPSTYSCKEFHSSTVCDKKPSPFALQFTFTNLIRQFQLWKSEHAINLSFPIAHDIADFY